MAKIKSKNKQKSKELLTRIELELLPNHKQIRFAIFCANQVIHLVPTKHKEVCKRAINTAELYLKGKASKEECRVAAADAAANATYAAAYAAADAAYAANAASAADAAAYAAAAANAAYYAAYAAASATSTKEKQNIIEAQYHLYDQLLNEDRIFEEIVLGKI